MAAAPAQRRQRTADHSAHEFDEQREPVALVSAERQQPLGSVRIGRRIAIRIHRRARRQRLVFAAKLLHATHRHRGGSPVDHDRESAGVLRWDAPGVRVRPQHGKPATEGYHLSQR